MKTQTLAALLIVSAVAPARAQQMGGMLQQLAVARVDPAEMKLLQIEQETDETLLREALLALGKKEMRGPSERANTDAARESEQTDIESLRKYIQEKKAAIIERSARMNPKPTIPTRANRPLAPADPARSEEIEKTKVKVQLLQSEVNISQEALAGAIENLARAEVSVKDDEEHKNTLNAARKAFESIQAKHVEFSKRLKDELARLTELDPQSALMFGGMGGFGGGMGGMGGGMGGMGGMR